MCGLKEEDHKDDDARKDDRNWNDGCEAEMPNF